MSENHERHALAKAGVEKYGKIKQMLMIAEESTEVAHAVLKWKRAFDRFSEKMDTENTHKLLKRERALMVEVQQLRLVLEIAPIVLPHPDSEWLLLNCEVLNEARERVAS